MNCRIGSACNGINRSGLVLHGISDRWIPLHKPPTRCKYLQGFVTFADAASTCHDTVMIHFSQTGRKVQVGLAGYLLRLVFLNLTR